MLFFRLFTWFPLPALDPVEQPHLRLGILLRRTFRMNLARLCIHHSPAFRRWMGDLVWHLSCKKEMPNPWIQHVKDYAKKHKMTYGGALKAAKASYRTCGGMLPVEETLQPRQLHHMLIEQVLHSNRTRNQQLGIMGLLDQHVDNPDPQTAIRNMIAVAEAHRLQWRPRGG